MKLLQKCTFLLALLVLVSPIFAEEHAAEGTPPPIKKIRGVHTEWYLRRYQNSQHLWHILNKDAPGAF